MRVLVSAVVLLLGTSAEAAVLSDPAKFGGLGVSQSSIDGVADGEPKSTTASYDVAGITVTRRLSVNQTGNPTADPEQLSAAEIGSGALRLRNDGTSVSDISLTYDFGTLLSE